MNRSLKRNFWGEILGFLSLALGIVLFLALFTYNPKDIPSWIPLISVTSDSNAEIGNLGGMLGAIFAGYLYFLFGVGAYFAPPFLIYLGVLKMMRPSQSLRNRYCWMGVQVVTMSCIFQVQAWMLGNWWQEFKIGGPGGWLGNWLGGRLLEGAFGAVASIIILGALYIAALILTVGFHPIQFIRDCFRATQSHLAERKRLHLERLSEEQRLAEEIKRLEKEKEKAERKSKRATKRVVPDEPVLDEPIPEPKIIDTSIPSAERAKPTLEEINARLKNQSESVRGLSGIQLENYQLPGLDLLDSVDEASRQPADPAELKAVQEVIVETLQQFGIECKSGDITKGPTITRYELYPARGVRVDRILSLERDIARATRAERINILAPVPGKDTVGIEIANSKKTKVTLSELFETDAWLNTKAKLPLALGKDVYGNTIIGDLAQMPHCLVAGTTGSGKSVCINSIIASLLFRFSPEELRFIMIDPKVVEMQIYNKLPHLVTPVVTDPKKVLLALRWVIDEMELRYKIFAKVGVRNIGAFNSRPKPKSQAELDAENAETEETPETEELAEADFISDEVLENAAVPEAPQEIRVPRDADELIIPDRMSFIVVIIDELADLMQTAPADVESAIARITQMARAAGIHMIVATQTPRADVVTGIIKANIPSRVAFQVASKIDSRVILDENGADKLLGQGDMLYLPPGTSKLTRAQGVLVTDEEIRRIVDHVASQADPQFEKSIHDQLISEAPIQEDISEADEELVQKCLEIIKQERKASTSMLQRRLRLGYTRAARVVDILEQRGIVGPKDGAKDREILVDLDSL